LKTVLITGAASGLGAATAALFISNGYRVVSTDIIYKERKDERPGLDWLIFPMDISSDESVKSVGIALKELGISIDILINNAGVFDLYPLTEIDTATLEKILQINTLGASRLIRAFLPDLIMNTGRVVQISSESVKFPGLFQPYQVSKISLEAYSRSVRQELALKGIQLVLVRPGAIKTGLYRELSSYENPIRNSRFDNEFERFVKRTSKFVGRIMLPEQVAAKIFRAATVSNPKYIYRINNNPLLSFLSLLPDRFIDRMVVKMVGNKN
jgi:NAD(P)-dependent dehydrogenase (short-subunit alcohol dehydrogenase family)